MEFSNMKFNKLSRLQHGLSIYIYYWEDGVVMNLVTVLTAWT